MITKAYKKYKEEYCELSNKRKNKQIKTLTISSIQTDLIWEQPEANMAALEEKIAQIDYTDLIILPEMFTTGFSMNAEYLAEPIGGRTFKWMRQVAMQHHAAVVGSYIVKHNKKFFNRLYFVFPDGSSKQYDKKHLFSLVGEQKKYASGDEKLIVKFRGWRICPMICYDLRFPVWIRSQADDDQLYEYDLLIFVANWPSPRINTWNTLLKARAIENLSYCTGVNRIGKDGYLKEYPGHSAIYSFNGEVLDHSKEEKIISSKLSLTALNSFREKFAFQKDSDVFHLE